MVAGADAERLYKRALKSDPLHAPTLVNYAALLQERGAMDAAEELYIRLLTRAVDDGCISLSFVRNTKTSATPTSSPPPPSKARATSFQSPRHPHPSANTTSAKKAVKSPVFGAIVGARAGGGGGGAARGKEGGVWRPGWRFHMLLLRRWYTTRS